MTQHENALGVCGYPRILTELCGHVRMCVCVCVCAGVHARLCLFHVCECRAFRYNMLLLKLPLQAPIVSSNRVVFWRVCRSDDVRARECACA